MLLLTREAEGGRNAQTWVFSVEYVPAEHTFGSWPLSWTVALTGTARQIKTDQRCFDLRPWTAHVCSLCYTVHASWSALCCPCPPADGCTAQDDAVLLASGLAASQDPGPSALAPPRSTVVAATTCLSANACCMCSVALVARAPHPHPQQQHEGQAGHRPRRSRSRHHGVAALPNGDAPAPNADGGGDSGSDSEGSDGGGGAIGGPMVLFSICTTPDVAPSAATAGPAGGGITAEDATAATLDTLRLAWAILHRLRWARLAGVLNLAHFAWLAPVHGPHPNPTLHASSQPYSVLPSCEPCPCCSLERSALPCPSLDSLTHRSRHAPFAACGT